VYLGATLPSRTFPLQRVGHFKNGTLAQVGILLFPVIPGGYLLGIAEK